MDIVDETSAEPTSTLEGEQVEGGVEAPQTTPETASPEDLLDPSLYGDFKVPVKVNGQEQYVPLRDMTSGYMMQSDYTQKTQALAAERERLAQAERLMIAMDADPEGTLRALQEAFEAQGLGTVNDDEFDDLTPEEQRLAQLESWKAEQEARELDQYIQSQVSALKAQHGEFQEADLFDFMIQNGIKDFNVAYGAMSWQREQQRRQLDAQAGDAKRSLPPVAGGRSSAPGSVTAGEGPPQSFAEAAAMAARELGL